MSGSPGSDADLFKQSRAAPEGLFCFFAMDLTMLKIPMTEDGFVRLEEELKQLKSVERPAIIRAIAEGTAPADLTIRNLTAALPHDWAAQEQRFLVA